VGVAIADRQCPGLFRRLWSALPGDLFQGALLIKKPLKNNALLDILVKKLKVLGQCGRILG
jgi:hypothetical protein